MFQRCNEYDPVSTSISSYRLNAGFVMLKRSLLLLRLVDEEPEQHGLMRGHDLRIRSAEDTKVLHTDPLNACMLRQ